MRRKPQIHIRSECHLAKKTCFMKHFCKQSSKMTISPTGWIIVAVVALIHVSPVSTYYDPLIIAKIEDRIAEDLSKSSNACASKSIIKLLIRRHLDPLQALVDQCNNLQDYVEQNATNTTDFGISFVNVSSLLPAIADQPVADFQNETFSSTSLPSKATKVHLITAAEVDSGSAPVSELPPTITTTLSAIESSRNVSNNYSDADNDTATILPAKKGKVVQSQVVQLFDSASSPSSCACLRSEVLPLPDCNPDACDKSCVIKHRKDRHNVTCQSIAECVCNYCDSSAVKSAATTSTCPPGWLSTGDHCLRYANQRLAYDNAEIECQRIFDADAQPCLGDKRKAHLPSFHSAANWKAFETLRDKHGIRNATWTGINDKPPRSSKSYSDGSAFDWGHLEDNDYQPYWGKEKGYCVRIEPLHEWRWYDEGCDATLEVFCQVPIFA